MMDWLGETSYNLDALGRVTRYKAANGDRVSYEWGLLNERKAVIYSDGSQVDYEFDINGRIQEVISSEDITEYIYNPRGTIAKEILPIGIGIFL